MIKLDTYNTEKSLVKQLRDAAMIEKDTDVKMQMKASADDIWDAIVAMQARRSGDALTHLNGLWVRGIRVLNMATDGKTPPSGQAGVMEMEGPEPRMAMAA
jgi:hypothetical protein